MNGTFGTVEVRFSAEALSRLANLTDVVERLSGSIATAIDQIGRLAEAIAANGGGIAAIPARAVADPVSTHAPGVVAEPAAPSTPVDPASTAPAGMPSAPLPQAAYTPVMMGRPTATWTPERVAILRRDYPAGVPLSDMLAALNALPGTPITGKALGIRAAGWGIRRPPRASAEPVAVQAAPSAPIPTESPPSPTASAEGQPGAAREPRRFLDVSSQSPAPAGSTPPPASLLPEPSNPPAPPTAVAARRPRRPLKDSPVWPQEKVDRLRELWATDLTTEQIGVELGVNRNTVIGKAHRLKLSRPNPILSPPVEYTDAEIAIFLANPDKPAAAIVGLFPNRTIGSLRAKRRTLQERGILPPLPSVPDRPRVTETLPALASSAPAPARDDPSGSDGAPSPATASPAADASALPWQMAVPSIRTRQAPTCGFIIGEGRRATQCDAPAVTLDEAGNRYQSGAGMWCKEHRGVVYAKVRQRPSAEAMA